MKKLLLSIISFVFMSSSYSQCVYSVDDFTGETVLTNKLEKIGKEKINSWQIFFAANKKGNTWTCSLQIESNNQQTVNPNDEVLIRFMSGKVIKAYNTITSIGESRPGKPFTIVWFNNINFEINEADITTFKNSTVTKIRCCSNDYEVNKPEIIQEQISCLYYKKK